MEGNAFKLTVEEANVLDKIAAATKMDCWFCIDEDLHIRDIEEGQISSDAKGVCMLEDGLAYGLDEPQSGGLSPEEVGIAEACFARARAALERIESLPRIKLTLEAMSTWEDWEMVCHMAGAKPEYTSSVTLYVAKADVVRDEARPRRTGIAVKATVTFQRWDGDCARFNGEAEFDACDALDSMDDEEIAQVERGDPHALDEVYKAAVRLGQIHDYDGPFEVELDEDNLSDYLEARKGLMALIKTHNSSVSARELKEELEIRGIPSEYADTGLWVRPEDLDCAESVLAELEAGDEEGR